MNQSYATHIRRFAAFAFLLTLSTAVKAIAEIPQIYVDSIYYTIDTLKLEATVTHEVSSSSNPAYYSPLPNHIIILTPYLIKERNIPLLQLIHTHFSIALPYNQSPSPLQSITYTVAH